MPERISPQQTERQTPVQTRTRREILNLAAKASIAGVVGAEALIQVGLRTGAALFLGIETTKPEITNPQESQGPKKA